MKQQRMYQMYVANYKENQQYLENINQKHALWDYTSFYILY